MYCKSCGEVKPSNNEGDVSAIIGMVLWSVVTVPIVAVILAVFFRKFGDSFWAGWLALTLGIFIGLFVAKWFAYGNKAPESLNKNTLITASALVVAFIVLAAINNFGVDTPEKVSSKSEAATKVDISNGRVLYNRYE